MIVLLKTLVFALGSSFILLSLGSALPTPSESSSVVTGREGEVSAKSSCKNPRLRKEWRRQSDAEKRAYIKAVRCLHEKPAKYGEYFSGVRTRYDDFVALHINSTVSQPPTHNNGYFFPWHRYAVWIFENTLRDECQYNGTQPYWDWTLDNSENKGDMATSPVWHPTLGYGGNGNWTKRDARGRRARGKYDGCLQDGPFMDYPLHLGFGAKTEYNPRCLKRDFDLNMMEKSSSFKNVIAPILSATSYDAFQTLEVPSQARNAPLGPHSLGHLGVGGEMANLFSSTGDPLFWIHHGGIDKLWYVWQKKNETHFNDVVASTVPYGRVKGAKMLTSLNSEIGMGVQAPSMPIKALIDPLNRDGTGILCYKYD